MALIDELVREGVRRMLAEALHAEVEDHGIVELPGAPEFDEAWRGDPDAVRRYRAALTGPASAFLTVEGGLAATGQGVDADGTLWQRSSPALVT